MKDVMFLGKTVSEVTLKHAPIFSDIYSDFGSTFRILEGNIIDIKFSGIWLTPDELKFLRKQQETKRYLTLAKLGPSVVCENCGYVKKPGVLECPGCSGFDTGIISDSHYHRMGKFAFVELETQSLPYRFESEILSSITFRVVGEMMLYVFETEFGNPFAGWLTTHIKEGWICRNCNCVNAEQDQDCLGCGSRQLPFSDISDLRTHCLYCGTPLMGKTVCALCSSAEQGYRVWPARLDWS